MFVFVADGKSKIASIFQVSLPSDPMGIVLKDLFVTGYEANLIFCSVWIILGWFFIKLWNCMPIGNPKLLWHTGTCFIQKIYAPSSSLLQGKHLPFSPSPLRLNIFRLFVILSSSFGIQLSIHWMITSCCACVGIRNNNKFSQFITYLQVVPTETNFVVKTINNFIFI